MSQATVVSEPEIDSGAVVVRVVVENASDVDDDDTGSVFVCRLRGFDDVAVETFPEGQAPGLSGEYRATAAQAAQQYALDNRERFEELFARLVDE